LFDQPIYIARYDVIVNNIFHQPEKKDAGGSGYRNGGNTQKEPLFMRFKVAGKLPEK
jgi:hypothetical protein